MIEWLGSLLLTISSRKTLLHFDWCGFVAFVEIFFFYFYFLFGVGLLHFDRCVGLLWLWWLVAVGVGLSL